MSLRRDMEYCTQWFSEETCDFHQVLGGELVVSNYYIWSTETKNYRTVEPLQVHVEQGQQEISYSMNLVLRSVFLNMLFFSLTVVI